MIELPKGKLIAGVDEVGRGPLAGPVVACAVILPHEHGLEGLTDSKKLSESKRDKLAGAIKEVALSWKLAQVGPEEIDRINIFQASLLAMKKAVEGLNLDPDEVWVDGKHVPNISFPTTAIVKGDALVSSISAASILAKVARDQLMVEMAAAYPGYGFDQHKGYPTAKHREALKALGVSEIHRKSYAPVKKVLAPA